MRDAILARVRANAPAPRPHPGTAPAREAPPDPASAFAANANLSASRVVLLGEGERLAELVRGVHPDIDRAVVNVGDFARPGDFPAGYELAAVAADTPIDELAAVPLAVLRAEFAVIENGACWVPERLAGHRALPFSAEHLVLVLPKGELVATMHEAYARIRPDDTRGFGVFIAGPSKTADIEQSLVIGAQGPRSLTVVLT